jgi:hypothetical protein
MKKVTISLVSAAVASVFVAGLANAALISEIRIDDTGADDDEYFEIVGAPGESLDGLSYIVIGDNPGCGVIESVTDLTGKVLDANGFYAGHKSGTTGLCSGYTEDVDFNFENSDNVTHLLVSGLTGLLGDKLDADEDGILEIQPWASIVDGVALSEGTAPSCATNDEYLYTPGPTVAVGPDGSFVPGHVYRCGTSWLIGPFDTGAACELGEDTPGGPNNCPTSVEDNTWGGVKALYR